jgi:hypothetical protein
MIGVDRDVKPISPVPPLNLYDFVTEFHLVDAANNAKPFDSEKTMIERLIWLTRWNDAIKLFSRDFSVRANIKGESFTDH